MLACCEWAIKVLAARVMMRRGRSPVGDDAQARRRVAAFLSQKQSRATAAQRLHKNAAEARSHAHAPARPVQQPTSSLANDHAVPGRRRTATRPVAAWTYPAPATKAAARGRARAEERQPKTNAAPQRPGDSGAARGLQQLCVERDELKRELEASEARMLQQRRLRDQRTAEHRAAKLARGEYWEGPGLTGTQRHNGS